MRAHRRGSAHGLLSLTHDRRLERTQTQRSPALKHYIPSVTTMAVLLSSLLLVGCEAPNTQSGGVSREYMPSAKPTQLAAYAASTPYPANLQAQENPDLVALVG